METETSVTAPETSNAPARWSRLAALGLFLAALAPTLMILGAVLWGMDTSDIGFFGGAAAVGLIASFLVWRFGMWSKIVGIIASILLMMMMFWTAFGLAAPNSFFDFVPGILVIPGGLIALVCCVAALVAGRRGHRTVAAEDGERRGIRIVLTAVIVLAAVSGVLTFTGRSTVDDPGDATEVALADFEFDQDEYTVSAGSEVYVHNDDAFMHTFTIDELDVDETLTASSETLITIPSEPGTYVVYCRPHTMDPDNPGDDEDDMAATITVE